MCGTRFATSARCTSALPLASWSTLSSKAEARVVTFGNGLVARELIVDVDDQVRRLVWAVVGSPRLTHHNASLQVFEEGAGRSRVVWIADLLPDEVAKDIRGLIEQGMSVMKQTLERA